MKSNKKISMCSNQTNKMSNATKKFSNYNLSRKTYLVIYFKVWNIQ